MLNHAKHIFFKFVKLSFITNGLPLKVISNTDEHVFNLKQLYIGQNWPNINFTVENFGSHSYLIRISYNESRINVKNPKRNISPKSKEKFFVKILYKFSGKLNELIKVFVAQNKKNSSKPFEIGDCVKYMPLHIARPNYVFFQRIQIIADIIKPTIQFSMRTVEMEFTNGEEIALQPCNSHALKFLIINIILFFSLCRCHYFEKHLYSCSKC